MSNAQIKIHNIETGEIVERDFSEQELAQKEKDEQNFAAKKLNDETKAKAKQDLLARLGITDEEAKLLLS